jgi:3-carboxy-cis,cis-muconate cycloisomerase
MCDGDGVPDLLGFTPPEVLAATSDEAVLGAMLDVEAALARAGARAGLIPAAAAEAIVACCTRGDFDLASISARAASSASPVVPLVADLTVRVPTFASGYVHYGATSQDVVDSALSRVAARVLDLIVEDLTAIGDRLASLAAEHRQTVQVGRTLLQHAGPLTFGMVCAGWLVAVDEAAASLDRVHRSRLAVSYGGPVGTLAALGDAGAEVARLLADELGLTEPVMPWHTNRTRVGELAGALGVAAGVLGGIACDVALLAQADVAELRVSGGGSSAMPHKRNPAAAVIVTAATHRVPGLVATLLSAAPQELARAAGRWQAEWPVLVEALRAVATAAHHGRLLFDGLRVDQARMLANLAAAGDAVMSESVSSALATAIGRGRAHEIVSEAVDRSTRDGTSLRNALAADADVTAALGPDGIDAALAPQAWLGSASAWIDRALHAHEQGRRR